MVKISCRCIKSGDWIAKSKLQTESREVVAVASSMAVTMHSVVPKPSLRMKSCSRYINHRGDSEAPRPFRLIEYY